MDLSRLEKGVKSAKNYTQLSTAKDAIMSAGEAEKTALEAQKKQLDMRISYINSTVKNLLDLAEIHSHSLVPMPTAEDEK